MRLVILEILEAMIKFKISNQNYKHNSVFCPVFVLFFSSNAHILVLFKMAFYFLHAVRKCPLIADPSIV